MTTKSLPFGVLLRRWRERRRMTQEDLALAAESSTRHLSCLETGRAQPSREMILRLAEHLEIPLRDQNALLLAAGFAPAFDERPLAELGSARVAIEQVLEAHQPYPAFAVDRHWNVVLLQRRAAAALRGLLGRADAPTGQCGASDPASARHGAAHHRILSPGGRIRSPSCVSSSRRGPIRSSRRCSPK